MTDHITTITMTTDQMLAYESGRKAAMRDIRGWCEDYQAGYASRPIAVSALQSVIDEINGKLAQP